MNPTTKDYTLPRTGQPPLSFCGRLLAQDLDAPTTRPGEFKKRPWRKWTHYQWHQLAVYVTIAGKWVLHVGYRSVLEHEWKHDAVYVCADAAEVVRALEGYDPTAHVRGHPRRSNAREERLEIRQARILEEVRGRWQAQVGRLLAAVEDFGERVG